MERAYSLDNNLILQEMKKSIEHCMVKNYKLHWRDFLLKVTLAWICIGFLLNTRDLLYVGVLFIASIFTYHSIAFMHEFVHSKDTDFKVLTPLWHFFVGIPFLVPLFLYRQIHLTHHSKKYYSTTMDAEYLPFGLSRVSIILQLLFNFVVPFLVVFRFLLMTPATYLNKNIKLLIENKLSFIGFKYSFDRKDIPVKNDLNYRIYDFLCFFYLATVLVLVGYGYIPLKFIYSWYLIMLIALTFNSIRSFGSTHLYKFKGSEVSFDSHILDSINVDSESILTYILCPVGLQYHGVHHIFPSIPYHNLKESFNILKRDFPNHPYIKNTTYDSIFSVFKEVLRN